MSAEDCSFGLPEACAPVVNAFESCSCESYEWLRKNLNEWPVSWRLVSYTEWVVSHMILQLSNVSNILDRGTCRDYSRGKFIWVTWMTTNEFIWMPHVMKTRVAYGWVMDESCHIRYSNWVTSQIYWIVAPVFNTVEAWLLSLHSSSRRKQKANEFCWVESRQDEWCRHASCVAT